jgi:hypothetical protein
MCDLPRVFLEWSELGEAFGYGLLFTASVVLCIWPVRLILGLFKPG